MISCVTFPVAEAVKLIQEGKAPRITQPEEGATYDKMWKSKDQAKINWAQDALISFTRHRIYIAKELDP